MEKDITYVTFFYWLTPFSARSRSERIHEERMFILFIYIGYQGDHGYSFVIKLSYSNRRRRMFFLYEFYICEVWVSCIQLPIIILRQINLLLAVCNLKYSLERHIKLKTSYNPTKLITQKSRRFGIFQSTWQYHLWKISKREPSKWMLCTKQEFVSFGL